MRNIDSSSILERVIKHEEIPALGKICIGATYLISHLDYVAILFGEAYFDFISIRKYLNGNSALNSALENKSELRKPYTINLKANNS